VRQFVPRRDQQVCVILKIKIVDELLPFYVGFDTEVSVGQVIQFLRTLCTERKECIMWRLCVLIWTQPQWLNCLLDFHEI